MKLLAQNFDIYLGDGLDPYARTGSINLDHLLHSGIDGIILGHSEVGDSPDVINQKLHTVFNHKKILERRESFTTVVLVGEIWEEFEGKTSEKVANIVENHCKELFSGVKEDQLTKLILGYEPKWGSRGSGRDDMPPPQPDLISLCIRKVKEFFQVNYKNTFPHYIYGGRSTPERTEKILHDSNVNGLILGSACNTVQKTLSIIDAMKKVKENQVKVTICNFKAYNLSDSYEKYVEALGKLSPDNVIYLAPSYTDLKEVKSILL
ncbi:hypothetical protein COY90_02270 [Candidatus Roizmanbacteria bacterium CG_4_10_14_0_8_um_filter_39_9]|uniref:Triose-phosphate isomerase n=1 Tax=Candidatus Roizmanbacteria bacterium CG_4_10_14_0_8_um_filter_39_9 TaxID=1974829 RepID=A0A2M7QD34_9BACT|nr:MAG: hypothetical protein COY90_02270 [Candidatus Roizmanbacteria bacterium CG_4_10_14_0_8_um_filter_39_9]